MCENREISRTPESEGVSVVQRIKDGTYQLLKETVETSGEIPSIESELLTIETIKITRRIGIKQQF